MNMYRKFWQHSKTLVCAVLFTICLISGFSVTASAESIETEADFTGVVFYQKWNGSSWSRFASYELSAMDNPPWQFPLVLPRQSAFTSPVIPAFSPPRKYNGFTFGLSELTIELPEGVYGDVGLYFSWFVRMIGSSAADDLPNASLTTYDTANPITVTDSRGAVIYQGNGEMSFYDVVTPEPLSGQLTKGVSCTLRIRVPEGTPVIKISMGDSSVGKVGWLPINNKTDIFAGSFEFYIPNAVLLASRTSAELQELEDISNLLMDQMEMTQDKFTEVIEKVDDLYTELGTTNGLLEEAIQQFEDWDTVTSVPGAVQDKVDKADQVIQDINSLVKPDPGQIVPSIDTDTGDISSVLQPFFSNALIVQLCTMVLGFAFVSYVLFGKKG